MIPEKHAKLQKTLYISNINDIKMVASSGGSKRRGRGVAPLLIKIKQLKILHKNALFLHKIFKRPHPLPFCPLFQISRLPVILLVRNVPLSNVANKKQFKKKRNKIYSC